MSISAGGGGGKPRPVPTVNVTPLVDVTLVVLIIFMVVTPLMTKTFWLNLPKQDDTNQPVVPNPSAEPLVLTVDKGGVIRINKTVVKKEELKSRLPRFLAAKHQKVLYFDAHDDVPYGVAVEAMDLSRSGGARSIAILTQKVVK
ncbi:MAG: biopolymer transporter ExbD [Polyangiaceae bacterium]|nr:biopolymer transporter ExbD [Polyangiaceae bacterium]